MYIKFSASTNGFYDTRIHGQNIPAGAVSLTDEEYEKLLKGQEEGFEISSDKSGRPLLKQREIAPVTKEQQEVLRRGAYAAEADPLFFKWQAGEATEEEWLAKRQEVRDRYPYPAE